MKKELNLLCSLLTMFVLSSSVLPVYAADTNVYENISLGNPATASSKLELSVDSWITVEVPTTVILDAENTENNKSYIHITGSIKPTEQVGVTAGMTNLSCADSTDGRSVTVRTTTDKNVLNSDEISIITMESIECSYTLENLDGTENIQAGDYSGYMYYTVSIMTKM